MNKILVIADLVEDEPLAIKKACTLAELYDASLHIVHFCFVPLGNDLDNLESIKATVIDNTRAQAEKVIEEAMTQGIKYSHEVEWCKHIPLWVNDYVNVERPCLIVKTGHRSETMLYTPTDWRILRESDAPLYMVHDNAWKNRQNILAAVDLDTHSSEKRALNAQILNKARELADFFEVDLHACFVPHSAPILKDLGLKFPDEVELEALRRLEQTTQTISEEYGIAPQHIHIKAGEAQNLIPSIAAETKAGIVVVGTIGRSGLAAKVIGNTAEKILALLKTDVLALKPEHDE